MRINGQEAFEHILKASSLILTTHINPDGDALGSMLALYGVMTDVGKSVRMIIDDELPAMYRFLPDIDKIEKFNHNSLQADLLVILDVGEATRTGAVFTNFSGVSLNIDHHLSNREFADWVHVDETASATGLILQRMFQSAAVNVKADTATCLFTAIATDCGFFRYANTDAETLATASILANQGANPHWIAERIDEKPVSKVIALAAVLNTLEFVSNGTIAAISVTPDIRTADVEDTESFIDHPRSIIGVELAMMFKPQIGKNTVKVSFRSKTVDVSRFAASFGGGGHARAAGCTVKGDLIEVKKLVLD
jgi:bifunctional oligoribonuclease and PAP phosphatase NrnA